MIERTNGKKDHEAEVTLRALRRAARRARELGVKTGTPVYVIKDQRIVNLTNQRVHKRKPINHRQTS